MVRNGWARSANPKITYFIGAAGRWQRGGYMLRLSSLSDAASTMVTPIPIATKLPSKYELTPYKNPLAKIATARNWGVLFNVVFMVSTVFFPFCESHLIICFTLPRLLLYHETRLFVKNVLRYSLSIKAVVEGFRLEVGKGTVFFVVGISPEREKLKSVVTELIGFELPVSLPVC